MWVKHISRTSKAYYLHFKTSTGGKPSYYFSMDPRGPLAATIPDGYEIYENVGGQVFLRKKTTPIIRPEELAMVEAALSKHGEPWQYRAEVKKKTVVVFEAAEMNGLDEIFIHFRGSSRSREEKLSHANYVAVLRFTLADKATRAFLAERFCFRGSVDDWITIGGPGGLAELLRQFVKHLGQNSFYDLF